MPGNSPPSLLATLRGSRLLRGIDPRVIAELAASASTSQYKEDELLWRAGQPCERFSIIQRGLVQIQRRTRSGTPAVVAIFGPSESVGDLAALERAPYPADAVAVTDVTLVTVPADVVLAMIEREPELARATQKSLLDHTKALVAKIDIVSAGAVPARLAELLLHFHERFGDEDAQGTPTVPIPLSRTALARLVSARPETVIRALSSLQKQGVLVATDEGFAIPELDKLEAVAREG